MTLERSKCRDFLSLFFITKNISKKFLIYIKKRNKTETIIKKYKENVICLTTENNCTNKIVLACRPSKKFKKMHVWLFCKNTRLCTNYYFLSHQLQKCNFSLLRYCLPQHLCRSVLLAVNWVLSSYLNYFTVPWCSSES